MYDIGKGTLANFCLPCQLVFFVCANTQKGIPAKLVTENMHWMDELVSDVAWHITGYSEHRFQPCMRASLNACFCVSLMFIWVKETLYTWCDDSVKRWLRTNHGIARGVTTL